MGRVGVLLAAVAMGWWWTMVVVEAAVSLPPEDKPLVLHYYKKLNTCANVEPFVRHQVKIHWNKDQNLTGKLVKLLYADCMVDAVRNFHSILLDGPNTEKTAPQNAGLGGFEVIDKIKKVLEIRCPRAVSCADILNLAARDAVYLAGAPSYPVYLGRRDGFESNAAWVDLPTPSTSLESALNYFQSKGLDVLDLTTLLGSHTMGRTHCKYIWDRLYDFNNTGNPDPTMKKSVVVQMRKLCPREQKPGQSDPIVYMNPDSGTKFSNSYYTRVLKNKAVLGIDQKLKYGNETSQIADEFSRYLENFRKSFALSMSRMGGLKVLTGDKGEIRRLCRFRNI